MRDVRVNTDVLNAAGANSERRHQQDAAVFVS
jgi:hypothetical protein